MQRLLIIFIVTTILSGCSHREISKQPTITVTIEPLRYFAHQIAGDRYQIQTMVPAGNNPETYEPTPRQMVELNHTTLYFKVGRIGFETTWMRQLQENAPQMKVIDTSVGIVPAKSINGIEDPHTWMSCLSARHIAYNIYRALCQTWPADSSYFKRNYQQLIQRINILDQYMRQKLRPGTAFIIYHPTLTYFARDYHLQQLPIEEEGHEPSARQIQQLIQLAQTKKAHTIFVQQEFSPRNTVMIMNATGAHPYEFNPLAYNWFSQMRLIAQILQFTNTTQHVRPHHTN